MNKRLEEQLERDPIFRERYAKMPPWPKAKPKPAVAPVEVSDQVAAAAKANPEGLRVRVSARDENNVEWVDPPQRGRILTDEQMIERHRQILHNEMEARWASRNNPPLVQRDYDPIRRFEEGFGE